MRVANLRRWFRLSVPLCMCLFLALGLTAQTIRLHVDLTDAPRNIYHAHLQIPVHAGEMSLVFPKWIPGNHRPSGPIGALTGIHMEAGGQALAWRRDPVEMYEFHVTVPAGVETLDVSLDAITSLDSAGARRPGGFQQCSRFELECGGALSQGRALG